VSGLNETAEQTGRMAREVLESCHLLCEQAETLRQDVNSFLTEVHAA
jgi:methyl-accepting chemotaxis protein